MIGAHSAVGRALAECLDERELDGLELIRATTTDQLGPGLELVSEALLRSAELVILAFSGPVAEDLAEAARRLGRPVLDLAGVLEAGDEARYIWPGLDPQAGRAFDPEVASLIPLGLAAPLVTVLRALAALGALGATVVTLESAASRDQPGIDELDAQVRGVFTLREVEPRVFRDALAFNLSPSLAGEEGGTPFDADDALAEVMRQGLTAVGGAAMPLAVTRILAPTFSAEAAVVEVAMAGEVDFEVVAAAIRGAPGLHLTGEAAPSARDAVGRDDALVGRLRVAPNRVSLWIAADRLRRGSATLAVLALEQWVAADRGASDGDGAP